MTHLIPAEFLGTSLEIIDHNGQKWLTADQVGKALGYNEANARIGVINLYSRHIDEFFEFELGCIIDACHWVADALHHATPDSTFVMSAEDLRRAAGVADALSRLLEPVAEELFDLCE